MKPMITIDTLAKSYGDRVAVRDVSLAILEGEIFGLLGPNGAGKTTTLSILATLLIADAGRVTIAGHDLAREADKIKPLIGLVPQELALYPTLSARDNLAFFGRIYGLRGAELEERIATVLAMVGLTERAKDAVQTFSGGMKRRLNMAAGLIHHPRILFLDEPTVGIDPQSRNFIFEHVERLKAEGMTIIYTTHYMEEAERLCDRVAIIDEGRILALDVVAGLTSILGAGVIYLGIPFEASEEIIPSMRQLGHVRAASAQTNRLKIEAADVGQALSEVVGLCNARGLAIRSLEVLEPNLETVFLHLTGKHLRE